MPALTRDRVEAPVHAVDEIDVRPARRPEEVLGARRLARRRRDTRDRAARGTPRSRRSRRASPLRPSCIRARRPAARARRPRWDDRRTRAEEERRDENAALAARRLDSSFGGRRHLLGPRLLRRGLLRRGRHHVRDWRRVRLRSPISLRPPSSRRVWRVGLARLRRRLRDYRRRCSGRSVAPHRRRLPTRRGAVRACAADRTTPMLRRSAGGAPGRPPRPRGPLTPRAPMPRGTGGAASRRRRVGDRRLRELVGHRLRLGGTRDLEVVAAATQVDHVVVVRVLEDAREVALAEALAVATEQLARLGADDARAHCLIARDERLRRRDARDRTPRRA